VGGLQRWTSIDFPAGLAAVVFLQGCPWRCSYCQNPGCWMRRPAATGVVEDAAFLRDAPRPARWRRLLRRRATAAAALPAAMAEVRALGLRGRASIPAACTRSGCARCCPLVDWIGLDVKAPWHRLDALTASRDSASRVLDSLLQVLVSRVAHECRTTWSPELFPLEELHTLTEELSTLGVKRWCLQQCRGGTLPHPAPLRGDLALFAQRFESFEFRAA
jgi:pyruvate formate lyase activating enzyme